MADTLLDGAGGGAELLRRSPILDLRRLTVAETESEIVLTGTVVSYYLKQMAQEAVRPALNGRRLKNRVTVRRPVGA